MEVQQREKRPNSDTNDTCPCCGSELTNGYHLNGPYNNNPYRVVCEKCWHKSFLHFPDKTVGKDGLSYPTKRDKSEEPELRTWDGIADKRKLNVLLVEPNYYTRYPPLGLLKLSTFHKSRGDEVELVRFPEEPLMKPNLIYVTSLFTFYWNKVHEAVRFYKAMFPRATLVLGGVYASLLPDHAMYSGADYINIGFNKQLDDLQPDYSLSEKWGWKASIVFSSRGCIRKCRFCAIPTLEGQISNRTTILDIINPQYKKIVVWDNNILAAPHWRNVLDELQELHCEVDFNQGFDARLITQEAADKIFKLKTQVVRLAFDNYKDSKFVNQAISLLSKAGLRKRKIMVYVLFNYTDTPDDFFMRTKQLLLNGVVVYPMRYEPLCALRKNEFISPNWSAKWLNLVQQARRVMGFAGAFPPYAPLVRKFDRADSFNKAFELRPSLEEIRRKLPNVGEYDAKLVYAYYKKHDLTTTRLALDSALLRIKEETEELMAVPIETRNKKEQKRLRGSLDWR